jgi:hypothetical protein
VDTPFMSVDIRANENSFLILEINGSMGIGYEWVSKFCIQWLFSRILSGLFSFRGFLRISNAIFKIAQRQMLAKKWEFEIL